MQSKTSAEGFRESIKHRQEKAPRPLWLPETKWAGLAVPSEVEAAPGWCRVEAEVGSASFSSSPRTGGSSKEHGRGCVSNFAPIIASVPRSGWGVGKAVAEHRFWADGGLCLLGAVCDHQRA